MSRYLSAIYLINLKTWYNFGYIQVKMVKVNFTRALKRFYPDLGPLEVECACIHDMIDILENKYPGLKSYLVDDRGQLRKHVNIFVQEKLVKDRVALTDKLEPGDEIYIMQALSGG